MKVVIGICPYCGQPAGRNELGYYMAVHPEHQAGTPFWCKWYKKERDAGRYRTAVGDLLLEFNERKPPVVNVGLLRMQELNRIKNASRKDRS